MFKIIQTKQIVMIKRHSSSMIRLRRFCHNVLLTHTHTHTRVRARTHQEREYTEGC